MNCILKEIEEVFIRQIQKSDSVLGAWRFGSETHGLSDDLSDVDIVLLIDGNYFDKSINEMEKYIENSCDEIYLCYPEEFNGEAIINNGYLISKDNDIFQFDIFLLHSGHLEDFLCRMHYTGLEEKDIIFDKTGKVTELISLNSTGSYYKDNITHLETAYWYHAYMVKKYLARKDFFKLYHIFHVLYEIHASMLLVGFDKITWGGCQNKLGFIPEYKGGHLKKYFCTEDFDKNRENILYCMKTFAEDTKEICMLKNEEHNEFLANRMIKFFS